MSFSTKVWIILALLAAVVFIALPALTAFYTDWLWFGEVGYRSVFWTVVGTRWVMAAIFGLLTFALLAANGLLARRMAPTPRLPLEGDLGTQLSYLVNHYLARYYALVILLVAAFFAVPVGLGMAGYWHNWQLFTHPVAFGVRDPIFHKDLSLYVFRLPMLQTLWQWLYLTLIGSLLLAGLVHYLGGSFRFRGGIPSFAPFVKAHLSVLLGLILFTKAYGYQLNAYNLLYSTRGVIYGATYADVHALLPVLYLLMALATLVGLVSLVNIFLRGLWLPAAGLLLLIAVSLVGASIYPAVVQRFQVAPNELAAETPYLRSGIAFTNTAYGLDRIEERDFPSLSPLTAEDIATNPQTINNIRLWDYRPLRKAYKQLQELRPYYIFPDVDIDRYHLGSQYRQLMLSARELSVASLPSPTWQKQHIIYTHGYGVVASTVNEATEEGSPSFVVKNIPPETVHPELRITRPEIYYGETEPDFTFSLVRTRLQEVNYPTATGTVYTRYQGKGGVSLRPYLVRLAMTMRFNSLNILLTQDLTPESRILFRRHIAERLAALAPFLMLDRDPYIVIAGGRLHWIQDAYTVTRSYPYSQPMQDGLDSYNYIRNSVKAVTDAYDGTLRLYVADPADPIIRTYQRIFPGLFRPLAEMPPALRAHLRFPERMFRVQTEMLTRYHMRDPAVFYSAEDQWLIANELAGKGGEEIVTTSTQATMEPYYTIMRLPDEERESFMLIIPYTPANKSNMVAWLAANSDPPDYGKLLLYAFPRQELVYGPIQIESRIDQTPEISRDLTLWRGRGSEVIRGNLLVLPLNSSVLYAEPIFLRSEESGIPELKRIVLASGTRVVMRPTLAEALSAVVGEAVRVGPAPTAAPGAAPGVPPGPAGEQYQALARQAREQYQQAQDRLRAGDWAGYGQALQELSRTLDRLAGR